MRKDHRKSTRRSQPTFLEIGAPCIIVIAGDRESAEQRGLREEIANACKRDGIVILKTIRFVSHRVAHGSEKDRPLPLIIPEDAKWIYDELHRYDVAILALRATYVRKDPSMLPARRRQLLTLERFVRYKAYYGAIRSGQDIDAHLSLFTQSRKAIGCDGVDDPRILPFHIFNCPNDWPELATAAGQTFFTREHGGSNRLHDCSGLNWTKPKGQAARHGGPALRVARKTLEQGFHWDVSTDSSNTVYSADSVWLLRQKNSYINIYPNGHIRPPGRGYGTVKIWPRR